MARQPQIPQRPVRSMLRKHQELLRVQGAASRLVRSGIQVVADGLAEVIGTLQSQGFVAGSKGWRLTPNQLEVNDILLRGGIIGNDALTNPVVQTVSRTTNTNFSLTPSWAELAGINVTVPAGCSQVSAVVFGRMYVANNPNTTGGTDGAGTDAIYVSPGLAGTYAFSTPTGIAGNGGFNTTVGFESFVISGLTPGNTIRLNVRGSTASVNMAASANNYVSVIGSFTWLR